MEGPAQVGVGAGMEAGGWVGEGVQVVGVRMGQAKTFTCFIHCEV